MSKTWAERPLSKSKMALDEINKQLDIIKNDIQKSSSRNSLSLLEKIDIIEDWYALQHIVCKEKEYKCKECPFAECITSEWDSDLQDYQECCECKFDFGSGYAGDIIPYIDKYREKIDKYRRNEDDDEIHEAIEWRNRFQTSLL